MNPVLLIALVAVAVIVAAVRAGRPRRRAAPDVSVTLSVLPTRTAVVAIDADGDVVSATLTGLVQHAVREAFLFDAVDVVEVRRRDVVVERRHRPGHTRVEARAL